MKTWKRRKDPDEVVHYGITWAADMALIGETITASQWFVAAGTGLVIGPNPSTFTTTATTVWLSGGVIGQTYIVTNRINTSGGQTLDQSVVLRMSMR